MREGLKPVNPYNPENADNDTWEKPMRGQGYGRGAETANINVTEAAKMAAQERQKEMALRDAQESAKAIAEINRKISATDSVEMDQNISRVLAGADIDEVVNRLEPMTDAEIEIQATEEAEADKLTLGGRIKSEAALKKIRSENERDISSQKTG